MISDDCDVTPLVFVVVGCNSALGMSIIWILTPHCDSVSPREQKLTKLYIYIFNFKICETRLFFRGDLDIGSS
jgi:hypothetical protein